MVERDIIDFIKMKIAQKYPTFGAGSYLSESNNPLAVACMGKSMTFAAGVDVEDVVLTVMQWHTYLLEYNK